MRIYAIHAALALTLLCTRGYAQSQGSIGDEPSPSEHLTPVVVAEPGDTLENEEELLKVDPINLEQQYYHNHAGGVCDCETQTKLNTAVAKSHKGLFYDNDFSYLCDPCYDAWWPGDMLKQRAFGEHITYDLGGQYRFRQHSERNFRGLGLTGNDDDFLLHRTRLFSNVRFGDSLRFYAEYIDAVSNYENFAPRPIEENRSDMLNLFIDGRLLALERGDLLARVGRQELLYGAQRAVSPLDWANTRRTFDGAKGMWDGDNWKVDSFWTRPVIVNKTQFDAPNQDEQFYGAYANRKGLDQTTLELFWLALDNDVTGNRYDSLGGRYLVNNGCWQFEFWGNYQFGQNFDDTAHSAAAWTAGIGRKFDMPWNPQLWVYYDWASGDDDRGAGKGYHHFFPLAHKYLGFMDFFGRRNIETPNIQFSAQPTKKIKFLVWYYYFFLENKNDTPYSVVMTPFNAGNAPVSADLGHEIDATITYSINARTKLLFGYSHFFAGDYYDTPGSAYNGDADFFYTELGFNF